MKHAFCNIQKKKKTKQSWKYDLCTSIVCQMCTSCQNTILFQDTTMNKTLPLPWGVTFTMTIHFSFKPYKITFKLQIRSNGLSQMEKMSCQCLLFLLDQICLVAVKPEIVLQQEESAHQLVTLLLATGRNTVHISASLSFLQAIKILTLVLLRRSMHCCTKTVSLP